MTHFFESWAHYIAAYRDDSDAMPYSIEDNNEYLPAGWFMVVDEKEGGGIAAFSELEEAQKHIIHLTRCDWLDAGPVFQWTELKAEFPGIKETSLEYKWSVSPTGVVGNQSWTFINRTDDWWAVFHTYDEAMRCVNRNCGLDVPQTREITTEIRNAHKKNNG